MYPGDLLALGDRITSVLSSGLDITERKRAEAALAAEKERFDVTLRSIGDGVITTDTQGVILVVNAVAEKLTGWTADEAIGRRLAEVLVVIDTRTNTRIEDPASGVLSAQSVIEYSDHVLLEPRDGVRSFRRMLANQMRPQYDRQIGRKTADNAQRG
jgi:PAS domain S-box-containing protein